MIKIIIKAGSILLEGDKYCQYKTANSFKIILILNL